MISPISTNSGIATSVNELAVFQMMSPRLGQSCVPRKIVIDTMPTRPIAAATGTPAAITTVSSAPMTRSESCQLN